MWAIEAGRQRGKSFSFKENGETIWSSVGIQKHDGLYKVHVNDAEESRMAMDEYRRNEYRSFPTLVEALEWIEQTTTIKRSELVACKGMRIFEPDRCH